MYDPFYWKEVELDNEYLETHNPDTERLIEEQLVKEYETRKAVTEWNK